MKILLTLIIFIFSLCLSHLTYASLQLDANHTLYVYLFNQTQDKLHFTRVAGSNPGNVISVSPKTIYPGERAKVKIAKVSNNDIEAHIIFTNSQRIEAVLFILDQEQIHYGQPIFSMSGSNVHTTLTSKTRNQHVGPRYLTYIEAILNVLPNSITQS